MNMRIYMCDRALVRTWAGILVPRRSIMYNLAEIEIQR